MLIFWLSTFVTGIGLGTLSSALFLSNFPNLADIVSKIGWIGGIASAIIAIFIAMTENGKPHVCGGSGLFLGLFSGFIAVAGYYYGVEIAFAPLAWIGGFLLLLGGFYSLFSLVKAKN